MPLFSGRLEGERGHSDRSIVSSLRRRHADSKSVMLVDTSFHRKKVSGVKRGMAGTRSCGGEKPDSGVATAPRRGCATMNNVASTRNAASKRKYDGAGGKVIRPVNILSMFPGCDGWCMEMRGCKRLENSFDAEVSQGECLERDSAMGNSSKRARLAGESPGDQKQEDLESDVRAGLPVCTTTQSSAAQKCKYTQARAEKLMRTLLGRFSNEALHRVEEFFGRVTGWDPGKEWPVTSKRRTKDWYRVQFERMLQSGKRLALVKRNRFNLELRGWPPKGGGQVGRADEKEQDFLATRISKQQSVSRNVVVSEAKKVCDTTRASDARGPPLAQDEKAASKVGITDQELGDVHPELRARLIAAEAWAATAEQRVSEVQQDSKVMQACLEGRVSWLEEEVVNIRAKLVAAAETKASLLAAVRKGKEESANAKALKQEAETRLSKLEQSVTNSEASRVKAENRWLQQEIKLTIAEEDRCSAETRVAELEHARLDLLQRLRRARGNCATANVGFATAQTRVATLTREVSELLRCLNAAREERKATSMRAAASEKRTVEAESRLAMLENNVWRYSEMLTDVLEDLWPGGQLMTPARHVAFIQELGTDPSRDRLQEEASFPLESGLMPGFETEGVEVVPSGAVVCAGPHSDTGDSVPRVVEQVRRMKKMVGAEMFHLSISRDRNWCTQSGHPLLLYTFCRACFINFSKAISRQSGDDGCRPSCYKSRTFGAKRRRLLSDCQSAAICHIGSISNPGSNLGMKSLRSILFALLSFAVSRVLSTVPGLQ